MADLLQAAANSFDLDPAAIALPMLTVAGAVIGNSRRLELAGGRSVPPAIWSVNLSPDDLRLSQARHLVLSPLIERHQEIAEYIHLSQTEYFIALDDWNRFRHEIAQPKPLPPATEHRQYFFQDPDYRRLPEYLARQPRGCLIAQDDLSQWFKTTPSQCLSIFDAPPFTFDRAKSLHIRFAPHAFLAITGSISPGVLQDRSPDSIPIRLASRFLMAGPPQNPTNRRPSFVNGRIRFAWYDLITQLLLLDPARSRGSIKPILLPLHRKAAAELASAHDRLFTAAARQSDLCLRVHLFNLIEYIPRIALILQLATDIGESSPDFVDAFSISSAARIIEWFAEETIRIHSDLTTESNATDVLSIVTLISRRNGKITPRQLMRACRSFTDSASARNFLQSLAQKGLGRISWDSHENRQSPTFHLSCPARADTSPASATKTNSPVSAPRKKPRQQFPS